jgi:hypothetical protein
MQTDVVTGAFGYSGAAIARELGAAGHQVRTLTGHPGRASSGDAAIDVRPLDFTDADGLERDLRGAHTLYNTYWVRFPHGDATHAAAVANSRVLFAAAARAGIQRIVHVSITHADLASPYPYFSGKALVEDHLREAGVPYAIARPAILFGGNGVLMTWPGSVSRSAGEPMRSQSTRPGLSLPPSGKWCWKSGRRSAAAHWSCPRRAGRSRHCRPPSARCCAMCCSPARSTRPWRTAWPTPTGRQPAPPASPGGSPGTARNSAAATPMSSPATTAYVSGAV